MKICLVSPINPRNNEYLRDARSTAYLGGLRLKFWVEKHTKHKVDVVHSDIEDVYAIDYSKYDYVGITSYYPTMVYDSIRNNINHNICRASG